MRSLIKESEKHRIITPTPLTTYNNVVRGLSALFSASTVYEERRWDGINAELTRPSTDSSFFEGCGLLSGPGLKRLQEQDNAKDATQHPSCQEVDAAITSEENALWVVERTHSFITVIPPNLNSRVSWLQINVASSSEAAERGDLLLSANDDGQVDDS
ncbi:hypothetical protein NM208_g6466 [Fusarium decemcellulare]|uniref:Uncharacterized protein n=1 Tax=Fusarium decemcellulare TaxID=57161 RepID=A0ACC1SCZ3_9HYPO|nr:hypothetical protein NM208_g6466 [Fusarium decemcellulare]